MGPKLYMRTQAIVLLALCSIYSLCTLWAVLQVSLNKGPGRVGLFANVFNVCVPVDGYMDGYSYVFSRVYYISNLYPCIS